MGPLEILNEQGIAIIDGLSLSSRQINAEIEARIKNANKILVINPGAKHNLGVGLQAAVDITFAGNVGSYGAGLIENTNIRITGNAGWFVADNLINSEVVVDGNIGAAGAGGMQGGTLVVRKNAASRIGQVMKGGTIIIGGNAGFMLGMMMMGGRIVVLGDVGPEAAESIMGGAIYVGGTISSLGKDAVLAEPGQDELADITSLVQKYFPGAGLGKLKKIVSGGKTFRYEHREDVLEARQRKQSRVALEGGGKLG